MRPSIGRVVHFYEALGCPPRPAFVMDVHEHDTVDLVIFTLPTYGETSQWCFAVPFSEEPQTGCWGWPPRVEGK